MPMGSGGGGPPFTGGNVTDLEIGAGGGLTITDPSPSHAVRVIRSSAVVFDLDQFGFVAIPAGGSVGADDYFYFLNHVVPADGNFSASSFAFWLDATPGATKLMIKAKDSGGTVRTAAVALA